MTYIAVKTRKNHYKFINLENVKQTAGEILTVVLMFTAVYLMMFL